MIARICGECLQLLIGKCCPMWQLAQVAWTHQYRVGCHTCTADGWYMKHYKQCSESHYRDNLQLRLRNNKLLLFIFEKAL